MPTRRSTWVLRVITVLAVLSAGVLAFPTGCYYFETPTRTYRTASEAQPLFAAGTIAGTDMPGFRVPASADRLRFTLNIDTEQWWFVFHFAQADSVALLKDRRRLDAAEARELQYFTPFWFRGWPTTFDPEVDPTSFPVYVAATNVPNGCLAVDWRHLSAFAWRCRNRAT